MRNNSTTFKHSMALLFTLTGLVLNIILSPEVDIFSIISWSGFSCFIGYFIAGLILSQGIILQENFIAMGTLKGKTLDEIEEKVGAPDMIQVCTVTDTQRNGSLCTWKKRPYSITLLFDENNVCLGVNRESLEN